MSEQRGQQVAEDLQRQLDEQAAIGRAVYPELMAEVDALRTRVVELERQLIEDPNTSDDYVLPSLGKPVTDQELAAMAAIGSMVATYPSFEATPEQVAELVDKLGEVPGPATAVNITEVGWRDYSVEACGEPPYDTAAVCRSDGGCEWAHTNKPGRYLTLGEAVDAAKAHVALHAEWDALGAAHRPDVGTADEEVGAALDASRTPLDPWCTRPGGNTVHHFPDLDSPCECGERQRWGQKASEARP